MCKLAPTFTKNIKKLYIIYYKTFNFYAILGVQVLLLVGGEQLDEEMVRRGGESDFGTSGQV